MRKTLLAEVGRAFPGPVQYVISFANGVTNGEQHPSCPLTIRFKL